jgi:hypothetical protein
MDVAAAIREGVVLDFRLVIVVLKFKKQVHGLVSNRAKHVANGKLGLIEKVAPTSGIAHEGLQLVDSLLQMLG